MSFRDHFSNDPAAYAEFRPHYPRALFEFLAGCCRHRRRAWDCATGNGQAAVDLAELFPRVVATDASPAQIGSAFPHARIEYRVARAEESGLEPRSVDLVTVAQSLHWFDVDAFWEEARRVAHRHGVIAVWCYGLCGIAPEIDPVVLRFYKDEVGPYWPPERRLVDEGYLSIDFPFEVIPSPELAIEAALTLDGFGGYLRTWSATRRYIDQHRHDPVRPLLDRLREPWGAGRTVRWPLSLRVGRID